MDGDHSREIVRRRLLQVDSSDFNVVPDPMGPKKGMPLFIDALDACLMVHGSWLKAHALLAWWLGVSYSGTTQT